MNHVAFVRQACVYMKRRAWSATYFLSSSSLRSPASHCHRLSPPSFEDILSKKNCSSEVVQGKCADGCYDVDSGDANGWDDDDDDDDDNDDDNDDDDVTAVRHLAVELQEEPLLLNPHHSYHWYLFDSVGTFYLSPENPKNLKNLKNAKNPLNPENSEKPRKPRKSKKS